MTDTTQKPPQKMIENCEAELDRLVAAGLPTRAAEIAKVIVNGCYFNNAKVVMLAWLLAETEAVGLAQVFGAGR